MKLTKKEWKARGVWNSHDLSERGTKIRVMYRPGDWGRAYQSPAWQVVKIGWQTDPKGHWRDNGHKTFTIHGRADKEAKLQEALAWARKVYKIKEWERDPWGDWHPMGTLVMAMEWKQPKEEESRG